MNSTEIECNEMQVKGELCLLKNELRLNCLLRYTYRLEIAISRALQDL